MADYILLKKWKKEQLQSIKLVHPEWDDKFIEDKLDKIIDKKLRDPDCILHNNYRHKTARTSILALYQYINDTKPIIGGGGVLFKNQHQAINPPSSFLAGALQKRKDIKKGLKVLEPGSYAYMMCDLAQLTEKVVANSYYGASGNPTSPFFNMYTALSVTATGQALISTMMCAFEGFYSDNVKFYTIGDFLNFIRKSQIKDIDYIIEINDMPDISVDSLYNRFEKCFKDSDILGDYNNQEIIIKTLMNLTPSQRKIVFYSNNLFEFIKIPSIKETLMNILYKVESFKDPNNVPSIIKDDMDQFFDILKAWVIYNHPTYNRINRLKLEKRKCVVTIDTDSNMLNIYKFMDFLDKNTDISKAKTDDENELMYIRCNIFCYLITKYSDLILSKYATVANIPKDFHFRLNMKNEFFYLRMILTSRKKSYCGLIRLREGKELIPEKPDNKGLQFIKSTAAPETKEYFKKLTKDILYKKNISTTYVLSKVKEFGDFIENDINQGNKTFLNPLSVKDPEAYEKPFRNQGIRGVYVWNCVYPDMQIELPDKVTIAKVKMETRDEILKLKCIDSEIYEVLMKSVFDNYDCPFRDKGISVIAIPSNIDSVPEWIRYFIDKDKIVNDNLSKFYMIMESLGIKLLDTRSNDTHYSNIVSF